MTLKKIIVLLTTLFGVAVVLSGCSYYNDTYKGETAYALVPTEVPEKEATKDKDGKVQDGLYSYNYDLTFVKEDGTTQKMEVEVSGENPTALTPDSYITAEISAKRVTKGPNPVSKDGIPENVLKVLDKQ